MAQGKGIFSKNYYDKWSESYDTGWRLKFWFWRTLRKTWSRIKLHDGASIYDMGCGTGRLLQYVHESYPGAKLHGSDISQGMLDKAHERFKEIGSDVELWIADMNENFPWADSIFDYVITTFCFHHSKNPEKTFGEVLRVLKPGGIVYYADLSYIPPVNSIVNWAYPRVLDWQGHIEFLSRKKVLGSMSLAGFTEVVGKRLSLYALFASARKPR